jgi:16S rRNA processing protein RimM
MPAPGDTDGYLVVGRIGGPHGVRGEVRFKILTDFPERLVPGKRVYVGEGREVKSIAGLRGGDEHAILELAGVTDRFQAGHLRNQFVYVHISEVPDLPEGELYTHALIGLEVRTETGEPLGRIAEVLYTGANDVLVLVDENGNERLIPAIDDVLIGIDLEAGTAQVRLLPGL